MVQVIRKSEQFNDRIFGGNFIVNKPVVRGGNASVQPYSSLFYWSHAQAVGQCEFGLHPHQGFEIMTFILEGKISHFDTASKVWTTLEAGDFQVMQSNSGLQHQERIETGTRSFQIWFDPNFHEAVKEKPTYTDFRGRDFSPEIQNGVKTLDLVGGTAKARPKTPGLQIKRLFFEQKKSVQYPLDAASQYTFYVLKGNGTFDGNALAADDAVRISGADAVEMAWEAGSEAFFIQTPAVLGYRAVWN